MAIKTASMRVFTPDGVVEVDPTAPEFIAASLAPYPAVAFRLPDGKIRRLLNFPMEIIEEESALVAPRSPFKAGA